MLRDKLRDIERTSYNSSISLVSCVRDNYQLVIARKEREITELRKELDNIRKKLNEHD